MKSVMSAVSHRAAPTPPLYQGSLFTKGRARETRSGTTDITDITDSKGTKAAIMARCAPLACVTASQIVAFPSVQAVSHARQRGPCHLFFTLGIWLFMLAQRAMADDNNCDETPSPGVIGRGRNA